MNISDSSGKLRDFDDWDDMIDDVQGHVRQHGFHLAHWNRVTRNEDGKTTQNDIGFLCNETKVTWVMDATEFKHQNPLAKDAYRTPEGKRQYLEALKFRFSLPDVDFIQCMAEGCERRANPRKDKIGFCGWCFRRFEKGEFDTEGNRIRTWEERKEDIRNKFAKDRNQKEREALLHQYAEVYPLSKKAFGCPTLHITMDERVCFSRIFLVEKPKNQCRKCHIHDHLFDQLENFLDEHNETQRNADDSGDSGSEESTSKNAA